MRKRILSVLFLSLIITFYSCNEDSIFYSKVNFKNGIATVKGIHPGGLENALILSLSSINHLVIIDTIDARDFKTMRDLMPNLQVLDLSKAVIASYNGYEGCAENRIFRYQANKIPEFAFYSPTLAKGKSSLKTIILPESIKSIGDYAFNNCLNLTGTLEIPASVTETIGRQAFSYCSQLTGLKLSGSKLIDQSAFQSCTGLTGTLIIPDSVLSIQPWAFSGCNNLQAIKISSTVTDIQPSAFNSCSGDFTVDTSNPSYTALDGVLFNIDQSYLIQCPVSKSGTYTIPKTVATIGASSFANCNGITSIVISPTTSTIEDGVFNGCLNLTGTFEISAGITSIGLNDFENCPKITAFNVDPSNTAFSFTDGMLIDMNYQTIKRCVTSKSGSIVLAPTIMYIDNSAFSNCVNITSITLPKDILNIGQLSFYNCTALQDIFVLSLTPLDMSSSQTAFEGMILDNCTLHVPKGTLAIYQQASVWKYFINIVEN
jgi:hypothetical protein